MTTREELRRLVEALPDQEIDAAVRLLDAMRTNRDPALLALLTAVEDDETETEAERLAVAEARKAYRAGEWVSGDEVKRNLGL